jgi:hypothetical protein
MVKIMSRKPQMFVLISVAACIPFLPKHSFCLLALQLKCNSARADDSAVLHYWTDWREMLKYEAQDNLSHDVQKLEVVELEMAGDEEEEKRIWDNYGLTGTLDSVELLEHCKSRIIATACGSTDRKLELDRLAVLDRLHKARHEKLSYLRPLVGDMHARYLKNINTSSGQLSPGDNREDKKVCAQLYDRVTR